jgi:DmsE family decaheme c-type cytochrome
MPLKSLCGPLLAAACLIPALPAAAAGEGQPVTDLIMAGDATCTRCHNDVSGEIVDDYPVLPIARTRHGTRADARTPTCTSCHGESADHVEGKRAAGSGRRGERPMPDAPFGRHAAANGKVHNDRCLACHAGDRLMHWNGSIHARRDVPCSDCHKMHLAQDPATTREKLAGMCMSCHKEKRAQFSKPNHHPVPEGQMVCTDCHNPHGSAGPKLMVKDSVNDTCFSCHMEYRGPFLWNHQPVVQSCVLCHNPHGTVTAGLLKARPPFLCQQCHEPTSHRGNFPGLDGTTSFLNGNSGLTQARGCPNCHTNIHGGNNPSNAGVSGTSRAFRR